MNIWRAWAPGPEGDRHTVRHVVWATSERACRAFAKNEWGDKVADVKAIDLPTTKAELVEWLNANVNSIAR